MHRVDRICKELNVHYCLIGGTVLGAVWHGDHSLGHGYRQSPSSKGLRSVQDYCRKSNNKAFFLQGHISEKNHPVVHAIFRMNDTEVVFKHDKKERCRV